MAPGSLGCCSGSAGNSPLPPSPPPLALLPHVGQQLSLASPTADHLRHFPPAKWWPSLILLPHFLFEVSLVEPGYIPVLSCKGAWEVRFLDSTLGRKYHMKVNSPNIKKMFKSCCEWRKKGSPLQVQMAIKDYFKGCMAFLIFCIYANSFSKSLSAYQVSFILLLKTILQWPSLCMCLYTHIHTQICKYTCILQLIFLRSRSTGHRIFKILYFDIMSS